MKKILSIVILPLLVLGVTSCKRTVQCPAFDDELITSWFPYEKDKLYIFESNSGNMDTLVSGDLFGTEPHEAVSRKAPLNGKDIYCSIQGQISSRRGEQVSPGWLHFYLNHHVSHRDFGDYNFFDMQFNKAINVEFDAESDFKELYPSSQSNTDYNVSTFDNIDLANGNYSDVRLIDVTNVEKSASIGLDKLYFAKGKGFIGYRTYPEKEEYWLKN